MPTSFRFRLLIGCALAMLFLYACHRTAVLEPPQETGLLATRPPTPYIRYRSGSIQAPQRALVIHGLDSSKAIMQTFCAALADAGFEVYSIDLPGHGDSRAGFNGVLAANVVEQVATLLKPDIAIGHSMGAALLIDLGHEVKFKKLVLMSPGPTETSLDFENTLVTTEQFDLPFVNTFAPELLGAELKKFPWGMHSSALLKAGQIREIVKWLGGDPVNLRTSQRLLWLEVMFASAIAFGLVLFPARPVQGSREPALSKTEVALAFITAGAVSIVVQRIVVVFHWIRLFAADYIVSFIFITGVALLLVLAAKGRKWGRAGAGDILRSLAAAGYIIVVPGLVTGSHLIQMTLSDGRWWRFLIIAAASFPLFLFDETATRQVGSALRNSAVGVLTRLLITAWIAVGVLFLNRESAFAVLLLAMLPFFWITLWFATGLARRHLQNPIAAALFAALIQGWMFAAWFVTT